MKVNRRRFIQSTIGLCGCAAASGQAQTQATTAPTVEQLDKAASARVLNVGSISSPIKIASIELLHDGRNYFVRTRSADGAQGIAVTNGRAKYLYPILQQLVAPYFVGKDARDLESLLDGVYVYNSNYKLSGLAFWCPVAWVEFSILDLLGKVSGKPVGQLLGTVIRKEVPMYVASGNRDTTAEQEADILAERVEQTGAKAVKFKIGGRMSNNADSIPGRTEGLVRLIRKELGDKITIYADANGSYDAPKAIEIGKLLQNNGINVYEEPCPFDHLEATRQVADALEIPISGGEQETSQRRFRWMIRNAAVQVVQPDLHYYGGFIRVTRVARMAAAAGLAITPHVSGDGVGCIDAAHLASFTPNMGPFQEFKGSFDQTGRWYDPPVQIKDGVINIPTGPGLGIVEDVLNKALEVK
jgi:L-alanine-DL-glutamate epimerase-like enolase superfamily enzyme